MIRKVRNKKLWRIISKKTRRILGTYNSIEKANKRLKEKEYFTRIK